MVVVVLAVILLGPIVLAEMADWARGAAIGRLWIPLALAGLAAVFLLHQ